MVAARFPTRILFEEAREGDIASAVVSPDKARRLLEWESMVPFSEGLADLMEAHAEALSEAAGRR
jgi:hypothetical protein